MNLHPELYNHSFYEHTTALEYSNLPNGSIFDITSYRNRQWIKSRFRKDEGFKMVDKLDANGEPMLDTTGSIIQVKKYFTVLFKTESRPLSDEEAYDLEFTSLQSMNSEIEKLLADVSPQIYELSMQFEAAWRNHTLRNLNRDVIQIFFRAHIHKMHNIDEVRTIRRIVTATIWNNASEEERQEYLSKI